MIDNRHIYIRLDDSFALILSIHTFESILILSELVTKSVIVLNEIWAFS
jgi:hypothetical protein